MFHSPGAIAIQLGPLSFRWYGILMASAMGLGLWLAYREAVRRGLNPDSMLKASELGLLGVGRRPRHTRRCPGWSPRWRRIRPLERIARHYLPGYRRTEPRFGAGHRPMGKFFQRRGVRHAHEFAVAALHLAAAPAHPVRAG